MQAKRSLLETADSDYVNTKSEQKMLQSVQFKKDKTIPVRFSGTRTDLSTSTISAQVIFLNNRRLADDVDVFKCPKSQNIRNSCSEEHYSGKIPSAAFDFFHGCEISNRNIFLLFTCVRKHRRNQML